MRTKVPEGLGGRRGLVCPEPPRLSTEHSASGERRGAWGALTQHIRGKHLPRGSLGASCHAGKVEVIRALDRN